MTIIVPAAGSSGSADASHTYRPSIRGRRHRRRARTGTIRRRASRRPGAGPVRRRRRRRRTPGRPSSSRDGTLGGGEPRPIGVPTSRCPPSARRRDRPPRRAAAGAVRIQHCDEHRRPARAARARHGSSAAPRRPWVATRCQSRGECGSACASGRRRTSTAIEGWSRSPAPRAGSSSPERTQRGRRVHRAGGHDHGVGGDTLVRRRARRRPPAGRPRRRGDPARRRGGRTAGCVTDASRGRHRRPSTRTPSRRDSGTRTASGAEASSARSSGPSSASSAGRAGIRVATSAAVRPMRSSWPAPGSSATIPLTALDPPTPTALRVRPTTTSVPARPWRRRSSAVDGHAVVAVRPRSA